MTTKINIPKKPLAFFDEISNTIMGENMIKTVAEMQNITYTLDYVNSKVIFHKKDK